MNGLWFFVLGLVAGPILIFGLLALLGRRGKTIEARDADVALGRSEVEQELPAGWKIVEADFESFSAGDRELDVWGAFAEGPRRRGHRGRRSHGG